MDKVKTKIRRLDDIFRRLSEYVDGQLTFNDNIINIKLGNENGEGEITGYKFSPGIDAILYDVTFNKEVTMEINYGKLDPTYFLFCLEGFLLHKLEGEKQFQTFDTLQNIILQTSSEELNVVVFPPKTKLRICVIHLIKERVALHSEGPFHYLCDKIELMFGDFPENHLFDHAGSFSSKTAVHVKNLLESKKSDAVGRLFSEACILNILSTQIANHESFSSKESIDEPMSSRELSSILSVSEFIQDNLSEKLTLKNLSQLIGMPIQKLQSGFLAVYNTTVNEYIRNLRLETAIELVSTTDLTLSEITYQIGLASKSYFSKLFKVRYGILPSEYRKRNRNFSLEKNS